MKELSISEKAKAYDEAIERAKKLYGNEIAEEIFHELKEGNDEKIRKAIRYAIVQSTNYDGTLINGVSYKEALYWLEKQGETSPILSNSSNTGKKEQKSADKIEQRFDPKTLRPFDKVLVKDDGDWIWRVDIISVPADYNDNIPYLIGDNDFDWIIPYNEETKHLVGTHDEAPEYYRYWEE